MNPNAIIQMMMNSKFKNNPMANNAFSMYQRNDTAGLKQLAENLCRENGMKPEDVLRQFGMK